MVLVLGNILWIWMFSYMDIRKHFISLPLFETNPFSKEPTTFPKAELFKLAKNIQITKTTYISGHR
jgi:hypothetical protein